MFFSLFLALRYLKPKRTFVSIITVVSVLGVALGVWLLTTVIAVFSGYGEKIKENILAFEPHLVVRSGGYIEDFVPLLQKLEKTPGVKSFTPVVWGNVIMEHDGRRIAPYMKAINLKEGDPDHIRMSAKLAKEMNPNYDPINAPHEPKEIPQGEFLLDNYSVVVGDVMAQNMGLQVGSKVLLYSPKDVDSLMNALDQIEKGTEEEQAAAKKTLRQITVPQEVFVTGIFDSGNWEVDESVIFLSLETGQVLYSFDLDDCHGIAIQTDDAFKADDHKQNILVSLGMGEWKTAPYSSVKVACQDVFRWGLLTQGLLILVVGGFLISQFLLKKIQVPILISIVCLCAIIVVPLWYDSFRTAQKEQHYVEQNGNLPYQLLTWMQVNKSTFDAIATERQAMYMILFMIMIVSGFCIMNTMITITFQKRAEIGLMKALGAGENQISWLFLIQGTVVGLLGIIIGLISGQITIWGRNHIAEFVGRHFGVELFSSEIYKVDGGLPASQTWTDIATISLGALIAATIAALIPALMAARLEPATALRSK